LGAGASRVLRLYTYALIAAAYVPLAVVALQSFNESPYIGSWGGFTLKWYQLLPGDERALEALWNSVRVAAASAAVSTLLGVAAALGYRSRRGLSPADYLVYPPLVLPEIVEAVALLMFLTALKAPLGPLTVFIGHTAFNVAYAYIIAAPSLKGYSRVEEAARTLGATPAQALLRVTLPLAAPGIASAAMLTFLLSFTDFIKTLFTTGPGFETLPLLIWNRARRPGLSEYSSYSYLSAIAVILIASSLLVAVLYTLYVWAQARRRAGPEV
jgi:spermidine/putrescine transport system permease protein